MAAPLLAEFPVNWQSLISTALHESKVTAPLEAELFEKLEDRTWTVSIAEKLRADLVRMESVAVPSKEQLETIKVAAGVPRVSPLNSKMAAPRTLLSVWDTEQSVTVQSPPLTDRAPFLLKRKLFCSRIPLTCLPSERWRTGPQ